MEYGTISVQKKGAGALIASASGLTQTHWRCWVDEVYRQLSLLDSPALRRCTVCGENKPLTEFYKRRDWGDGYRRDCRTCVRRRSSRWNEEHQEHVAAYQAQYRRENKEALLTYQAAYRAQNKATIKERNHRYFHANKERVLTVNRAYKKQNRERHLAYNAEWTRANPERRRANLKRYDQSAKGKRAAINRQARRRALKRGSQVGKVDFAVILERDGLICHICGGTVAPEDVQFDHVIPLARRGPHIEANIRVSHATCNRRKGAKLPGEGG